MDLDEEQMTGCAFLWLLFYAVWCLSCTCVNQDRHPMVAHRLVFMAILANNSYPLTISLCMVVVLKQRIRLSPHHILNSVFCYAVHCVQLLPRCQKSATLVAYAR